MLSMPKRQRSRYEGLYNVIYRYLKKVRGWSEAQCDAYLQTRPFTVLCRVNNRIVGFVPRGIR